MNDLKKFYSGKKVLLTGYTGFKGTWLTMILSMLGAEIYGYALEPESEDSLYSVIKAGEMLQPETGDIRDYEHLKAFFRQVKPEVVFHLAAQPLVRESYRNPRYTYETNVMGTVNVCECIRETDSVRSFLNVTTDKVYLNREWEWGYRETDPLDGFDPYSNSKSCSELVTHSYRDSFLKAENIAVSTARAGNVIGGGDFAKDRIIPDCVRSVLKGEKIIVRNPSAIRPFQHVLEPLFAYLLIGKRQAEDIKYAGFYNVGPDDTDCVTVGELTDTFCQAWGEGASFEVKPDGGPHEASFLKLDCSRMKQTFGWRPVWTIYEAVNKSVEWYRRFQKCQGTDQLVDQMITLMMEQIKEYGEKR